MKINKKSAFTILSLCAAALAACQGSPTPPESVLLWGPGDEGSQHYRIPAVTTAMDGSIIAVCDRRGDSMSDLPNLIDVVCKRSEDMGRTWSETIPIICHTDSCGYGDPALVVDRNTGDVLCIFAAGIGTRATRPEKPMRVFLCRSQDHGKTWAGPVDLTPQLYGHENTDPVRSQWWGGFAASGQATQMADGTLAFVIGMRIDGESQLHNFVCTSTDGGYHWSLLPTPVDTDGDESKIVELADGRWLVSIRNNKRVVSPGHRKFSISADKGQTWTPPAAWEDVQDPTCDGDLIRYTLKSKGFKKDRLLLSTPFDPKDRKNVSVLMSYDEGKTWPVRKTIWEGNSGYSSLTVLPDGSIGLFTEVGGWEESFKMYFTRITPEWLTDGADKYR